VQTTSYRLPLSDQAELLVWEGADPVVRCCVTTLPRSNLGVHIGKVSDNARLALSRALVVSGSPDSSSAKRTRERSATPSALAVTVLSIFVTVSAWLVKIALVARSPAMMLL
jgi:hypothetical protein